MRTDLLAKLADLLERNAANPKGAKFDLSGWGAFAEDATPEDPLSCGTVGCAMGLARVSNIFVEDGMVPFSPGTGFHPEYKGEDGRMRYGFGAIEELFNIDQRLSYWLFIDAAYPEDKQREAAGELECASRIRVVIEANQHEDVSERINALIEAPI